MSLGAGYEASEDKAFKEPLLANPDEPPPAPVMLAEPAPAPPVTLECSEPVYSEYPEPGPPGRTGGLVSDWLFVGEGWLQISWRFSVVSKRAWGARGCWMKYSRRLTSTVRRRKLISYFHELLYCLLTSHVKKRGEYVKHYEETNG